MIRQLHRFEVTRGDSVGLSAREVETGVEELKYRYCPSDMIRSGQGQFSAVNNILTLRSHSHFEKLAVGLLLSPFLDTRTDTITVCDRHPPNYSR